MGDFECPQCKYTVPRPITRSHAICIRCGHVSTMMEQASRPSRLKSGAALAALAGQEAGRPIPKEAAQGASERLSGPVGEGKSSTYIHPTAAVSRALVKTADSQGLNIIADSWHMVRGPGETDKQLRERLLQLGSPSGGGFEVESCNIKEVPLAPTEEPLYYGQPALRITLKIRQLGSLGVGPKDLHEALIVRSKEYILRELKGHRGIGTDRLIEFETIKLSVDINDPAIVKGDISFLCIPNKKSKEKGKPLMEVLSEESLSEGRRKAQERIKNEWSPKPTTPQQQFKDIQDLMDAGLVGAKEAKAILGMPEIENVAKRINIEPSTEIPTYCPSCQQDSLITGKKVGRFACGNCTDVFLTEKELSDTYLEEFSLYEMEHKRLEDQLRDLEDRLDRREKDAARLVVSMNKLANIPKEEEKEEKKEIKRKGAFWEL